MLKTVCVIGSMLISVLVPQCLAQSIHEQPNGTRILGSFQLGSVTVPLPPGEWVLNGRGVFTVNASTGPLKVGEAYLSESKDGKVTRIIYARANLGGESTGGGWTRDRNVCDRVNVIHAEFDRHFNPKEAKCWMVTHFFDGTPNNPSDAFREFYASLAQSKLDTPKLRLSAVYFLTDATNFVYVNYAFNPEIVGVPLGSLERWDSSEWNILRINLFPDRVKFAGTIKSFGEAMLPFVEKGLQGRIKAGEYVPVTIEGWPTGAQ